MLKAVIFDIDGTLVDSVDLHAQAWQEAFRWFGREVAFAEVRRQIGKGGDQLLPVFFSAEEIARFGKALESWRGDLFKQRFLPQVRAFADVRPLFERIRADGKRIALATSAREDEVDAYKKLADIEDLVDATASADDAEKSKPYPDIFIATLARLKLSPQEAIAVGDTPYDAQAAAGAGMLAIGVLCGGFPQQALQDAGCVQIYRDPTDLLAHYAGSRLASKGA